MMGTVRIPIACTLTSTDAADRIDEWRGFIGECVSTAERTGHELRLALQSGDSPLLRAADLAAREKTCCEFFSFAIEIESDARALVITVPAEASDILDDMTRIVPTQILVR